MSTAPIFRLRGEIETARPLRAADGHVSIRGWCLVGAETKPPRVRLTTPVGTLNATPAAERPDVAGLFPTEPAAGNCGFTIEGNLPAGVHPALFEAALPDGTWRPFKALSLHVGSPPLTATIETPASAGIFVQRIHLDGWAIHPAQSVRTLSLRYGHQEIPCQLHRARPDLASRFGGSTQATPPGFTSNTILSAGHGPLRLRAELGDGTVAVIPTGLHVAIDLDENHGPDLDLSARRIGLARQPAHSISAAFSRHGRPRRILFILPGSFAANSALHAAALANALARTGHTCSIAVSHDLATFAHHEAPLFSGVTHADARHGLAFADRQPPDLIHAWTTRENVRALVTEMCATIHRRPQTIVHLEDNELHLLAFTLGKAPQEIARLSDRALAELVPADLSHPQRSRQFLAQADGVTVITDRLREFVPAGRPCHTIWPAADERFFVAHPRPQDFRALLDRRPGETVLFYHGNIHAANVAEVGELYRAVSELNNHGHPTTLIRTGLNSAALANDVMRAARDHVLELGQIHHHHHLPALMALADIFVQPGVPDAFNDYRFPSKLPEFFAIGRPVILPRTNLGEHVRHGVDAYVLERADAAHIARAITTLRADPSLHERLSQGALRFAHEHFSWTRSAARLAEFYDTLAPA